MCVHVDIYALYGIVRKIPYVPTTPYLSTLIVMHPTAIEAYAVYATACAERFKVSYLMLSHSEDTVPLITVRIQMNLQ